MWEDIKDTLEELAKLQKQIGDGIRCYRDLLPLSLDLLQKCNDFEMTFCAEKEADSEASARAPS